MGVGMACAITVDFTAAEATREITAGLRVRTETGTVSAAPRLQPSAGCDAALKGSWSECHNRSSDSFSVVNSCTDAPVRLRLLSALQ